MPSELYDIKASSVDELINRLITNLVNIKDHTGQFLMTIPDGRVIDTKGWITGWEWTHGIGLYGMWHYYQQTDNKAILDHIEDWFQAQMFGPDGSTSKNINTIAVFLSLAYVYEKHGNEKYRPYLDSWAEWAMYDLPRTECGGMQHATYLTDNYQQMWDDTLMMTVMPLAKIGLLFNRPHYVEEAKKQMLLHVKYLADTKTGLWFHGYTFEGNHNFANALWARGNSWITIVIPEFIELLNLQPGDFLREFLLETLNRQVSKLADLQDDSGLWHTLLDDPSSYLESSASAGFAYGILKSVRKRYIDAKYRDVGVKAIKGVISQIDSDGELLNTSFGTGMGDDLQFYRDIPLTSMPYGQALGMIALVEYSKLYL
ncbi:BA75_01181T0 [Komagataella pastoris]|uniref:BA75_01181T0 n=1 Tax=Komagataella pastoris TaxID=4922 RepID=A0A1B2J6R2_PICPA|nr:BA75_01181T0 [Komagataella pastoris]